MSSAIIMDGRFGRLTAKQVRAAGAIQFVDEDASGARCELRHPPREFYSSPEAAMKFLDGVEATLKSRIGRGAEATTLSIPPLREEQFGVEVYIDVYGIHGWFGGLEQDFESIADAMMWVRLALSSAYRLHVVSIGSRAREWLLEPVALGTKCPAAVLASRHYALFGRFRKKEHAYKQNMLFSPQFLRSQGAQGYFRI